MNKRAALFVAVAIASITILPGARPARADTTSTALIISAAAAIVGAIIYDSNNQPFYVDNGRHVYVGHETATYYQTNGNDYNHYRRTQPQYPYNNGNAPYYGPNNGQYNGSYNRQNNGNHNGQYKRDHDDQNNDKHNEKNDNR